MKSLLCQKGTAFEILLIDDGSTDNSGEVCDSYVEKYPGIVRVVHKENEGLLLTRRRGFKEAQGDWFICIDSDDYADDYLLANVVKAIEHYQPDMVMYNFQYVNDSGEKSQSRLSIENESIYVGDDKQFVYAQRLLTDDLNNMWSKALKREIVDIDADYSTCGIRNMCEDAVQVLPLLTNAKKIVYLDVPLYYYRKGQTSITSKQSFNNWKASEICFLITEKYLDIWNITEKNRHQFYTHNTEALSNFLRWAFACSREELPESLSIIIHSVSVHPAFKRCIDNYDKYFASTPYLKFSVPRIIRCIAKEDIRKLSLLFKLERMIM